TITVALTADLMCNESARRLIVRVLERSFWPTSKMRTEAVPGGKLPSPPKPVKSHVVAVHTSVGAVLYVVATRVLRPSTSSAVGLGCVKTLRGGV
ncbi:MAG: hypothetical protein RL291_961, partial [Pseudomonadota bacterium]